MNTRLRNTGILALVSIIAVPIGLLFLQAAPALIVLSIIAVVGFFSVVFVSVFGSLENEAHPQSPQDSAAVRAWQKRLGETSEVPEGSETSS
jgi:hypothetical protein